MTWFSELIDRFRRQRGKKAVDSAKHPSVLLWPSYSDGPAAEGEGCSSAELLFFSFLKWQTTCLVKPCCRALPLCPSFFLSPHLPLTLWQQQVRGLGDPCRLEEVIQFSSVQFKVVSVRLEKPICAPPCLSEVPSMLPLKWFQCSLIGGHWLWLSICFLFLCCVFACVYQFQQYWSHYEHCFCCHFYPPPHPRHHPWPCAVPRKGKKRCMLAPFCFQVFSLWSEISSLSKYCLS